MWCGGLTLVAFGAGHSSWTLADSLQLGIYDAFSLLARILGLAARVNSVALLPDYSLVTLAGEVHRGRGHVHDVTLALATRFAITAILFLTDVAVVSLGALTAGSLVAVQRTITAMFAWIRVAA